MAIARKVASNRSYSTMHHASYTAVSSPLDTQRYYQVSGIYPRYEVTVNWDESTRQVLWGKKALTAFEVAMRIEGYKRHKPVEYR